LKTRIGVAEALAGITLPTTYMCGGMNGNTSMLESILSAKLLDQVIKK